MLFILGLGALLAGLMPFAMPLGIAAGGVFETGQVAFSRWWPGLVLALCLFALMTRRWAMGVRLYWLSMLVLALALELAVFICVGTGRKEAVPFFSLVTGAAPVVETHASGPPLRVGMLSALPFFWSEGRSVAELLRDGSVPQAPVTGHGIAAVDYVDAGSLAQVDALLIAQPRLLQPKELVALDRWVRDGGRALIFADPFLVWPGALSSSDPRRAPLTSLLDPLLSHWGLRLEPASPDSGPDARDVERRMLSSGHVLMLARPSRFSVLPQQADGASCRVEEAGLIALCRIGGGEVRLVADADVLDSRLWLADPDRPDRREAWSADVPVLVDRWLEKPLEPDVPSPPLRVRDERALAAAMRMAMGALLLWVIPGWAGHRLIFRPGKDGTDGGALNETETTGKGVSVRREEKR